MGQWTPRPELVCAKCGKAGCLQLWLPWPDVSDAKNHYNTHFCRLSGAGCGAYWRDEAAMLALFGCGTGSTGTTTVDVSGILESSSIKKVYKEERMFQVSVYLFASGTIGNSQFNTLAEARANLEKQVAGLRSSGPASPKTFFTASILDAKSGKYYGSVSDAPPPVVLSGGDE